MYTWTIFWRTGQRTVVTGMTVADALTRAGYGAGAVPAIDFHTPGDCPDYTWDATKRDWVRVVPTEKD
jgi:hypothetical protein